MIRLLKLTGGALSIAALVACGGGGGSAGTGTGSNSPKSPTIELSIVDGGGATATNVTAGGAHSARAVVKDGSGAVVANKLVVFEVADSSIATVSPETALTNAAGVATVSVAPSSITAIGATTLSASADVNGESASGQLDFSVVPTDISLTNLAAGTTSLASGGNTPLSVSVLVGGAPPQNGATANVTFATSCGRINNGGTSAGVTTNGAGVANATYTAVAASGELCSGQVTVTASSAGATPVSLTLTIAAPVANAITFVSATPSQIYVAGSGALEQSSAKFKVLAGTTPLANTAVQFSLTVNPGGVGLNASGSTAAVTGTTDVNGEVAVSVFSGTIPGPVKVRASLVSNPSVFAETQNLTVASGPPSQRFISLSVQTFNIEGWALDGAVTRLTARLADRQGNPVEDGTVVNFTAEGGQVAPSCATLKSGGISSCSVDFISQNPRPAGGRVSVLAYASGTKDYVDNNGNNRYDAATDTLVTIGDAYRDDNENAAFDVGEFVVPRGGASSCTGAGAPFPSRANSCDTSLATTVRQQTTIMFSSSEPLLTPLFGPTTAGFVFAMGSIDNPLLPMPAGTTVAAEVADRTEGNGLSCAIDKVLGTSVPNISPGTNPSASLLTEHEVSLKGCAAGDTLQINVTSPAGLISRLRYTLP